jgi:hypothetical protein
MLSLGRWVGLGFLVNRGRGKKRGSSGPLFGEKPGKLKFHVRKQNTCTSVVGKLRSDLPFLMSNLREDRSQSYRGFITRIAQTRASSRAFYPRKFDPTLSSKGFVNRTIWAIAYPAYHTGTKIASLGVDCNPVGSS